LLRTNHLPGKLLPSHPDYTGICGPSSLSLSRLLGSHPEQLVRLSAGAQVPTELLWERGKRLLAEGELPYKAQITDQDLMVSGLAVRQRDTRLQPPILTSGLLARELLRGGPTEGFSLL
jgi:hypothetical protein